MTIGTGHGAVRVIAGQVDQRKVLAKRYAMNASGGVIAAALLAVLSARMEVEDIRGKIEECNKAGEEAKAKRLQVRASIATKQAKDEAVVAVKCLAIALRTAFDAKNPYLGDAPAEDTDGELLTVLQVMTEGTL